MTLNQILNQSNHKREQITSIYLGRDHACRCGCCGTYADRGERAFNMRLNRLDKMDFGQDVEVEAGKNYINISHDPYNDKCFCIYFE